MSVDNFDAIEKLFEERKKSASWEKKYEHLVEVRRCVLTPSRFILLPPYPYQKNRLLRETNPDSILMVYAKDDNLKELNHTLLFPGTSDHCKGFLKKYIIDRLKDGITLVGRTFDYLGSSGSQLRDIGMVLYARESEENCASSVRKELGDFSKIKSPAKYIARVGQVFSQSIGYLPHIDDNCVANDDEDDKCKDITGGFNKLTSEPYTFSDGVGMISRGLAAQLTAIVEKNRGNTGEKRLEPYSAYQIRCAGAKGMVTLNPKLSGVDMVIRKSMKKFESKSTSIDVLKVSEPRYVHLCQPLLNILDNLKVDSSVFLTMARKEFQKMIDSFSCKSIALEIIENLSHLKLAYNQLRDSDIDILGEMFFRNILGVVVKNAIKDIKSKAQIKLPESFGRSMFGVLDDTNTLQEGQVFVQYSKFDDYMERKVVTGDILVTRFPCMHPGDIRKLEAVDVPELRHIVDCIVFPQQGSRPHPDQMGGGDLDGDEYAVIWEKSFLFPGPNIDAMEYPSGKKESGVNEVTVEDMLTFIVEFIQKDSVGPLCNAHLALSDQSAKGIFDEKCLKLAKQHPMVLDFAKNGELDNEESPRSLFYPDFMEKSDHKPTYKSKRVLGKLYRLSRLFEESVEFESILGEQLSGNEQLLTYPGWEDFEKEAKNAYYAYRLKMKQIQKEFKVQDELSLLSGCFTKMQKYICGRNDKDNCREMMNLLVNNVVKELRSLFLNSFQESVGEERKHLRRALASSWYLVTRRLNENNAYPYYGLPWIVSDVLCEIANLNAKNDSVLQNFDDEVRADDLNANSQSSLNEIEMTLKTWLENSLKTFSDFSDVVGDVGSKYRNVIQPFLNQLGNEERLDIALQRVLRSFSDHLRSGDEFENMLALNASMTLRRFRRTKKMESFTKPLIVKDSQMGTLVKCLRLHNHILGYYLKNNRHLFFQQIKGYGIHSVHCDVYGSSLIISAFGTQEALKKLDNALTAYYTFEPNWRKAEQYLQQLYGPDEDDIFGYISDYDY